MKLQIAKSSALVGAFLLTAGMCVTPALARPHSQFPAKPGHWVVSNAHKKIADLLLIGGYKNKNNGMNFNGYSNGKMKVTVPLGWTVDVQFENGSSMMPHSAMIVPTSTKGKVTGFKPAFPHASTPNPTKGLSGKGTQHFSFVAKKAGTYLIWCCLPGHGIAGMYDTLVVSAKAKSGSVSY